MFFFCFFHSCAVKRVQNEKELDTRVIVCMLGLFACCVALGVCCVCVFPYIIKFQMSHRASQHYTKMPGISSVSLLLTETRILKWNLQPLSIPFKKKNDLFSLCGLWNGVPPYSTPWNYATSVWNYAIFSFEVGPVGLQSFHLSVINMSFACCSSQWA